MDNKQHKVIVFTSPSCSWCMKTKDYLSGKKIRFKEIDISKNPEAAQEIQNRTGQAGVPVIAIDNKYIVGFDKDKIDRLLGLKK